MAPAVRAARPVRASGRAILWAAALQQIEQPRAGFWQGLAMVRLCQCAPEKMPRDGKPLHELIRDKGPLPQQSRRQWQ